MAKELNLNIRMDETEMDALKRAAAEDDRPVSALARRVLIAWLNESNLLTERRLISVPVEVERRSSARRKPS